MTVQIAPALSTCSKCGGRLVYDQVGHEVDVVCMTCGKRQVAVAEVPVAVNPSPARYDLGICEYCEEEFTPYSEWQRFCTPKCQGRAAVRKKSEEAKAALMEDVRVCRWCEDRFTPQHAIQLYCCKDCSNHIHTDYTRSLKKVKRNA